MALVRATATAIMLPVIGVVMSAVFAAGLVVGVVMGLLLWYVVLPLLAASASRHGD